jgi:serine/threonine-protein kinase
LTPTTLDLEQGEVVVRTTLPRAIMGSPLYMSPEQMESSGDVDSRTDIWALGVTLFELVTGKVPFTGTTIVQVYSQMLAKEIAWLKQFPGDAPPDLRDAIARCLRRDRTERHESVRALANALAPLGSHKGLERTQQSPTPSFASPPLPARRSQRRGTVAMLGAVALAGVVMAPLMVLRREHWTRPGVIEGAPAVVQTGTGERLTLENERGVGRELAITPTAEGMDPIALVPPATPSPPPARLAVSPPGSSQGLSAHPGFGSRPAAPRPAVPSSFPSDSSLPPQFNVDEMLKARE